MTVKIKFLCHSTDKKIKFTCHSEARRAAGIPLSQTISEGGADENPAQRKLFYAAGKLVFRPISLRIADSPENIPFRAAVYGI